MHADKLEDFTISRAELYRAVWMSPLNKLAASYGISGPALKELLVKHEIPMPRLGHWTRIRFGKPVERTSLPAASDPSLVVVRFHATRTPTASDAAPMRSYPVKDPELFPLIDFERDPRNRITVGDRLPRPHAIISRTREALAAARERAYRWNDGHTPPRAPSNAEMPIAVGDASTTRALVLMDALFHALEQRGHKIVSRTEPQLTNRHCDSAICLMLGEELSFALREKTHMVQLTAAERKAASARLEASKVRYEPTGMFELAISAGFWADRRWNDTPNRKLEDQLNRIVVEMLVLVENRRLRRQAQAETERQQMEAAVEQQRLQQLEQIEAAKISQLKLLTERWDIARRFREFAEAVRAEAIRRHGSLDGCQPTARWLEWVEGVAGAIDPLGPRGPLPGFEERDGK